MPANLRSALVAIAMIGAAQSAFANVITDWDENAIAAVTPMASLGGTSAHSRVHLDRAIALYDPAVHRPLATRFGQDVRVAALSHRSRALWMLGYPEAALADAQKALRDAREIGQAATLMYALFYASLTHFYCGNYAAANTIVDELIALANDKGTVIWKAFGIGARLVLCRYRQSFGGSPDNNVRNKHIEINGSGGVDAGELRTFDESLRGARSIRRRLALHCRSDGDDENNQGKLVGGRDPSGGRGSRATVAEAGRVESGGVFRACAGSRAEAACNVLELRASMSMARLWRDQGKRDEARNLLALVYGWFTEGFDTLDLNEAKALLDALAL